MGYSLPSPQSAQEDKAQKMAMHEQYIMGMLTNFDDGLPLSRIHNMLSMFVIDGSYTATEQDLRCPTSHAAASHSSSLSRV